jgi:hypothetical protein
MDPIDVPLMPSPFEGFNKSRGFTSQDMHDAAQALRMAGKGSYDPMYPEKQE